ncbi:MAG: UMP kinase [Patescibacteria group bacterium]
MKYLYQRILIKLSGELFGGKGKSVDLVRYEKVAKELAGLVKEKVQVAVVVGGGNIMRGRTVKGDVQDELAGHRAGIIATVVNGLLLQRALIRNHVPAVLRGVAIVSYVNSDDPICAQDDLGAGKVVLYAGGSGGRFLSTDTGAVIRALEIGANAVMKATHDVDGVYDRDPKQSKRAVKYPVLTFSEAIEKRLGILDLAAFDLAQKYHLPIHVFKWGTGRLLKVLRGEKVGSVVKD